MTIGRLAAAARAFAARTRGSAGIELALGGAAFIGIAIAAFSVYAWLESSAAVGRMAAVIADYASREDAPDASEVEALARFLVDNELGRPADGVYVLTAFSLPEGATAAVVDWVEEIALGDEAATTALAQDCGNFGAAGGNAALPDDFAMKEGEEVVAVEICLRPSFSGVLAARFVAGDLYAAHALPKRPVGAAEDSDA